MKAGAFEFFTKPIVPEVLLDAIRGALERSEATLRQLTQIHALQERYESLRPPRARSHGAAGARPLEFQAGRRRAGISEITVKAHAAG
jgi:FixJ family two-component response regulator